MSDEPDLLFPKPLWQKTRRVHGMEIVRLPPGAKRGPCVKCGKKSGKAYKDVNHEHHITYVPEAKVFLCPRCHEMITSVNSHAGMAKRAPLTNDERWFLWKWFLKTGYFSVHRRFSRGRAKILLNKFRSGGGQVTDAEIE